MSDEARRVHRDAVAAAQAEMGRVQEHLAAITELLNSQVIGMVYSATGGYQCNMESGRLAFQWTSGLADDIDEIYRRTDNINAELSRYASGF